MIEDIRRHLGRTPFIPFSVRTADGHEYPVPTVDHIWLLPSGRTVAIADDRGIVALLPALMISGLVHAGNGQAGPAES